MKTTIRWPKLFSAFLSAFALAFAAPSLADDKAVITSISEASNAVTIQGINFAQRSGPLQVVLNGFPTPLFVQSYGDTAIVATLPASLPAGSYSISLLVRANGTVQDEFFFTLGAQGPKGDTGDTGPAGATGQTGLKGDKGDKGDTGAAGAAGAIGATGAPGAKGATRATGTRGLNRRTGPP